MAFVNYLSAFPGVNGIPLSYVVREGENIVEDETTCFLAIYRVRTPRDPLQDFKMGDAI